MSNLVCFFVLTLFIVSDVSLCLAYPTDGASGHKDVQQNHKVTSAHFTTVAPHPSTAHKNQVSDVTKKPEGIKSTHSSTLHPSISEESVKVTTGSKHHETSHRPSNPPSSQSNPINSFKIDLQDSDAAPVDQLPKLCDFLKPICNSTDKIVPKQLLKIQGQFKKIVEMSAGKLGFCFLDHFGFDPNLNSITKANLVTLCSSKDLSPKLKGSYKSFETCAAANWDPNVDLELDKIMAARANCTKNHTHVAAKNESNEIVLEHEDDEDELSLISDVVNKVFEDNKGQFANSSEVKFIDVSGPRFITTPKPIQALISEEPQTTNIPAATNKTTLQHQADQVTISKNLEPPHGATGSTIKPAVAASTINGNNNKTTSKPDKSSIAIAPTVEIKSKPIIESNSTETEVKKVFPSKSPSLLPISTTPTPKPETVKTTEVTAKVTAKTTVTPKTKTSTTNHPPPPSTTTTPKPKPILETLDEVLKRQEKEKRELDERFRLERERVIKQLQKKQDEIDARNAIKALQYQRDATNNQNSDAKLHQLEHERQMSIDPIGHTIKHQQYEANKQQKIMNGRVK